MISRIYRHIYRSWPALTKVRLYHGQKVFLPRAGYSDLILQDQGAYEAETNQILTQLARPHSWMIDVGTNLGLTSIPVLASCPDVRVLSFEPSENAQKYLRRTMEVSSFKDRWELISKCVGAQVGTVEFTLSAEPLVEFDGIRHTGRVNAARTCQVPMTTIDMEWMKLGAPAISVIKADVEGGELGVLQGAAQCIADERPFVLIEWNRSNFDVYGVGTDDLLKLTDDLALDIYALPHMIPLTSRFEMEMQMLVTENFLLAPRTQ